MTPTAASDRQTTGDEAPDRGDTEGLTQSALEAIGDSYSRLSPRAQELLLCLDCRGYVIATGGPEDSPLRFGASGTAAVYTENAKVFHIIRKVILRLESLLNYLNI